MPEHEIAYEKWIALKIQGLKYFSVKKKIVPVDARFILLETLLLQRGWERFGGGVAPTAHLSKAVTKWKRKCLQFN